MSMNKLKLHIDKFFKGLEFDEKFHRYYLNGVPLDKSVSKICSEFAPKFNAEAISQRIAERDNIPREAIISSWENEKDISIVKGHSVHTFAENYYLNKSLTPSNSLEEQVVRFWNTIPDHIHPIFSELRMYHKKFLFAGTCDLLVYNSKKDSYGLVDWKTNKDLFKNYKGQKLYEPFSDMLDTPYSKYVIQLNLYKILLEQIKGIKVDTMKIVWLRENEFITFDCLDYKQELLQSLNKK